MSNYDISEDKGFQAGFGSITYEKYQKWGKTLEIFQRRTSTRTGSCVTAWIKYKVEGSELQQAKAKAGGYGYDLNSTAVIDALIALGLADKEDSYLTSGSHYSKMPWLKGAVCVARI